MQKLHSDAGGTPGGVPDTGGALGSFPGIGGEKGPSVEKVK